MCKKVIVLSTLLVSMGWLSSAALAQPPVKSGLVFWLDASNSGSLVLSGDKVSRWNDLSGAGNYADQTAADAAADLCQRQAQWQGHRGFRRLPLRQPARHLPAVDADQERRRAPPSTSARSARCSGSWGWTPAPMASSWATTTTTISIAAQPNQIWDGANGWSSANIRNGSTYLNGVKVDGTATVLPTAFSTVSLVTTANIETSMIARDRTYRSGGIKLGELLIFDRALTDAERVSVEAYLHTKWFFPGSASGPKPEDDATDVLRDVALSWTAGPYANTHDVYLGTAFADVNGASRTDPKGTLVSQGQQDAAYDAGRLEFGTTYYWRVDEVNAPPDSTIYKGSIWKFTVEPYSYPIAGTAITATASSSSGLEMGPQKTVDGSGMSGDQHGTAATDMWLSGAGSAGGTWIQYAFDKSYKLDQMLVWNSNQLLEAFIGFGAKSVTVEYSADGASLDEAGRFRVRPRPRGGRLYRQHEGRVWRRHGEVREVGDEQQLGHRGEAVRLERGSLPLCPGDGPGAQPGLRRDGGRPAGDSELAVRTRSRVAPGLPRDRREQPDPGGDGQHALV